MPVLGAGHSHRQGPRVSIPEAASRERDGDSEGGLIVIKTENDGKVEFSGHSSHCVPGTHKYR